MTIAIDHDITLGVRVCVLKADKCKTFGSFKSADPKLVHNIMGVERASNRVVDLICR